MPRIQQNAKDAAATLKASVAHVFKENPRAKFVLVVQDGHVFLPQSQAYCKTYCADKNLKHEVLTREKFDADVKAESARAAVKSTTKPKTDNSN